MFSLRIHQYFSLQVMALLMPSLACAGEFNDLCAFGLTQGVSHQTACSINQNINNKTYCFGSQDVKTEFLKDPIGNLQKASDNFLKIQAQLDADLNGYTPITGTVTKNNDGVEHQLQRRIDRNIVSPGARNDKELEWSKTRDF